MPDGPVTSANGVAEREERRRHAASRKGACRQPFWISRDALWEGATPGADVPFQGVDTGPRRFGPEVPFDDVIASVRNARAALGLFTNGCRRGRITGSVRPLNSTAVKLAAA